MDSLPLSDQFELVCYVRSELASTGKYGDTLKLVDANNELCTCGGARYETLEVATETGEQATRFFCTQCFEQTCRSFVETRRDFTWTNWIEKTNCTFALPDVQDASGRVSAKYADVETARAVLEVALLGKGAAFAIEALYRDLLATADIIGRRFADNAPGAPPATDEQRALFNRVHSELQELGMQQEA